MISVMDWDDYNFDMVFKVQGQSIHMWMLITLLAKHLWNCSGLKYEWEDIQICWEVIKVKASMNMPQWLEQEQRIKVYNA